ncbi:MAG: nicotinate-nucleotide--dimethylbenzimidazole phosphoribosyltransferase, partial [Rikenellaceae bacterium]
MRPFNIIKPDQRIRADLQSKVDNLTKPKGSLGMLEYLAIHLGVIQQSLTPELKNPHHVVFAA